MKMLAVMNWIVLVAGAQPNTKHSEQSSIPKGSVATSLKDTKLNKDGASAADALESENTFQDSSRSLRKIDTMSNNVALGLSSEQRVQHESNAGHNNESFEQDRTEAVTESKEEIFLEKNLLLYYLNISF